MQYAHLLVTTGVLEMAYRDLVPLEETMRTSKSSEAHVINGYSCSSSSFASGCYHFHAMHNLPVHTNTWDCAASNQVDT